MIKGTGNYQLTDEQFVKDTKEAIGIQIENCGRYRNLVGGRFNYNDIQGPDDLSVIEPVDVDMFKKSLGIFPELLNIPVSEIDYFVSSGGTGGDPSLVGRREKEEVKDGFVYGLVTMINNIAGLDSDGKWGKVYLSFPPHGFLTKAYQAKFEVDGELKKKMGGKSIIPYLDPIIEGLCPTENPKDRKYMFTISLEEGKPPSLVPLNHKQVIEEANEYVKSGGEGPVFFGGGVQAFYYRFILPALEEGLSVNLGEMGFPIVGAGGWSGSKGLTKTPPINKSEYVDRVKSVLGVPEKNIQDGYGSSESPIFAFGNYSKKYKDFIFKPPKWARIFIRDLDNPEKLITEPRKKGQPHIITPYGVGSFAGASILVNDIITPLEFGDHGECLAFTNISRAKKSDKGDPCGASAATFTNE